MCNPVPPSANGKTWAANEDHEMFLRPVNALLWLLMVSMPALAGGTKFQITYNQKDYPGPFTGRVYVMLFENETKRLRQGPDWFHPEPFYSMDVTGWKAGEPLTMGSGCLGFPVSLEKLPAKTYTVQAVMDLNKGGRSFATSPGNIYGIIPRVALGGGDEKSVEIKLDSTWKETAFNETERVKLLSIDSKLLSDFHGKPVRLRAGVALPENYGKDLSKKYPTVYEVPGFGGNHFGAFGRLAQGINKLDGLEAIWVVLDPDCPFGHHVFADSDNNGPYGQALAKELIPAIEKNFRCVPDARVVTGHSSGGWSSLWLQVNHPDLFKGVWSTAPDPVDFRDFQRIDLYSAPAVSMFVDEIGRKRPIARRNNQPVLFYRDFSDMEVVMGRGGQLWSFEAVFGPKGINGQPRPLWDRMSGKVDPAVMKSWERYDIRRLLEKQWIDLAPKLKGKIVVHCGSADTFYLEGAAVLLKESLGRLKSDAIVEIHPGKDHGNLLTQDLRKRMEKQMRQWLEKP